MTVLLTDERKEELLPPMLVLHSYITPISIQYLGLSPIELPNSNGHYLTLCCHWTVITLIHSNVQGEISQCKSTGGQ